MLNFHFFRNHSELSLEWFYFFPDLVRSLLSFTYFKVMREMLSEMVPGKETPDDLQLLDELHAVVKQVHVRIQDLIRSIQSDEVMRKFFFLNVN